MTQLIVGGITLPETSGNKYKCAETVLSETLEMASGRIVQEQRGRAWEITYQYDYMGNDRMRQILTLLRSGTALTCQYLPDNSDTLETSVFLCTNLTPPTFAFSRSGVGLWHNLAFTLREVYPHA